MAAITGSRMIVPQPTPRAPILAPPSPVPTQGESSDKVKSPLLGLQNNGLASMLPIPVQPP